MKIIRLLVVVLFLITGGWLHAQQDQADAADLIGQKERLDLMKSKGIETSLTILPIRLMDQPWERVSEVIGVLLEQKGLKNIELGGNAFMRKGKPDLKDLIDSLQSFISAHPVTTDYVLYAEMRGDEVPPPIDEVVGIILDKSAALVWTDLYNSEDDLFKKVSDPDPMGYSILLVDQISPQLGLNAETARNAKPGKFAAKMRERSGLPPEEEVSAMPAREEIFKGKFQQSKLIIYPVRAQGEANESAAKKLVTLINDAGLANAMTSEKFLLLQSGHDPNELKNLWDMAKEFRSHLKSNHQDGDYFLYTDYVFTKDNWQAGYVHFILCDRQGEWVIVDLQNSNMPDYISIKPTSAEDCNRILISRIEKYLKTSVTRLIKETINSSGIQDAVNKFHEVSSNTKDYLISEEEMNMLGYEFLKEEKFDEAIAVFIMNTEAFPSSFNTYDSLGEAYAAKGEKEAAIKNYEKSVQLNPDNTNGIEMLKKLKDGN